MRNICFEQSGYRAEFAPDNGRLCSFQVKGKELLAENQAKQPLMELRMLADDGKISLLTDADAKAHVAADGSGCVIALTDFAGFAGLKAKVEVFAKPEGLEFYTSFENNTDCFIENMACPCVHAPAKLTENGGEGKVFWGFSEGMLLDDSTKCDRVPFHGTQPNDRNIHGCLYPGFVNMQYMAYLTENAGFYIAAHDTQGMPKEIVPYVWDENIRMDIRPFPCVAAGTNWKQGYPIVLRPIDGTWEAASEVYREFLENSDFPLPPKMKDNPKMPKWAYDSPVVVIYPPRSVRGTGYMGPNEFFPYVNGLKYLDDLQDSIESKIMAFLPYWEGTAPWAPPFVWPPFGGEDIFMDFVREMHKRGNLMALYCSGLHWTDTHYLVPDYNRLRYRENHHLTEVMCELPGGVLKPGTCQTIRTGYTMCCACKPTKDIAYDQFRHILDADVDYIQYFDQHMGGGAYTCYAKGHGHPACFGQWSTDAMMEIYRHMNAQIAESNREGGAAFGAEGAPADFYANDVYFNDLRWHLTMRRGEPVPAYSYVLHEYTSNFMGNECSVDEAISRAENPDSLLHALAYSFIAGDALTLVLKSGGEIHYDWGLSWLHPGPRQEPVKKLTRNLNAMRMGFAKPYLLGGRMLPKLPFEQPDTFVMTRRDGSKLVQPEVLASCWQSENGDVIQIFANYREHDIEIKLGFEAEVVVDAKGSAKAIRDTVIIPALDCAAVIVK